MTAPRLRSAFAAELASDAADKREEREARAAFERSQKAGEQVEHKQHSHGAKLSAHVDMHTHTSVLMLSPLKQYSIVCSFVLLRACWCFGCSRALAPLALAGVVRGVEEGAVGCQAGPL